MTAARQLHLGAILEGVGTDQHSWRDPQVPGDASIDIGWYIENAKLAEEAKFDLVFIVDSPFITPDTAPHFLNRLEPVTLLSAVATHTTQIGLVGTLTTSYWEPYNVARQFGSLDHISRGRAGWNVVTTGLEGAARNYGREEHFLHADRYARANEFVDVVRELWDSYEDDAFPRNKASGVFLDKSKQHRLDHKGTYFSVAGPLALTRSRQGSLSFSRPAIAARGAIWAPPSPMAHSRPRPISRQASATMQTSRRGRPRAAETRITSSCCPACSRSWPTQTKRRRRSLASRPRRSISTSCSCN